MNPPYGVNVLQRMRAELCDGAASYSCIFRTRFPLGKLLLCGLDGRVKP